MTKKKENVDKTKRSLRRKRSQNSTNIKKKNMRKLSSKNLSKKSEKNVKVLKRDKKYKLKGETKDYKQLNYNEKKCPKCKNNLEKEIVLCPNCFYVFPETRTARFNATNYFKVYMIDPVYKERAQYHKNKK